MAISKDSDSRPYFSRSDKWGSLAIGFIVAICLFLVLQVTAESIPLPDGYTEFAKSFWAAIFLVLAFSLGSLLVLYLAYFLSAKIRVLYQAAKFGLVGASNTFIDLGILNFLIFFTSVAAGLPFVVFKSIAFVAALVNSYFWNKYWTFGARNQKKAGREFGEFILISIGGLFVNVGTATLIVNVIGAPAGMNPAIWANVGALIAVALSLIWNFTGYKFLVFKPKK